MTPELSRIATVVVLGSIMSILDTTIVAVALDTLGRDFRVSVTTIQLSLIHIFVSCLMLVRVSDATPFSWLFAAYVVFGVGFGFVNAPITNAAVSGMPRAQAGVASAIASTSRQIGATLGVAVVGALVTSKVGAVAGRVDVYKRQL